MSRQRLRGGAWVSVAGAAALLLAGTPPPAAAHRQPSFGELHADIQPRAKYQPSDIVEGRRASAGVALAIEASLLGQHCNMWQWRMYAMSTFPKPSCESFTTPYDPPPVPNTSPAYTDLAGTFYPRVVPKCKGGTNTGCSSSEYVRNIDGTRPFYHADPVQNSNKWIFFFEGGGSCGTLRGSPPEVNCMTYYNTNEWKEMSSQRPGSTSSNVKSRQEGYGINSAVNGDFTGWNKVWIQKGSFDRWYGNTDYESPPGPLNETTELYFHGRRIIKAVMKDLDRVQGATLYFPPLGQAGATALADLSSATHMMFVGHSGGAGGLIQNAEWLTGVASSITPTSKLTFLLDARMIPDAGTEAHFEGGSLWDADYSGTTLVQEDDTGADATIVRSNQTYLEGGADRSLVSTWGDYAGTGDLAFLDAGCLATHAAPGDVWHCFDERHVLLHHFDENVFLHQTLLDGTHARTPMTWVETVNGADVDDGFYFDNGSSPDDFRYDRANRVLVMAQELLDGRKVAGNRDSGTVPANSLGMYLTYGDRHVTVHDQYFFNHFMIKGNTLVSLNDALSSWIFGVDVGFFLSNKCWIQDASSIPNTLGPANVTYEVLARDGPIGFSSCDGWAATW